MRNFQGPVLPEAGHREAAESPLPMGRITLNGTITQFSAKIGVPVALWKARPTASTASGQYPGQIDKHYNPSATGKPS